MPQANATDQNELFYGQNSKGMVIKVDDEDYIDDNPQEKVIDDMEINWSVGDGGAQDLTNFKEGVKSWNLSPAGSATETSFR